MDLTENKTHRQQVEGLRLVWSLVRLEFSRCQKWPIGFQDQVRHLEDPQLLGLTLQILGEAQLPG